jgi:phosphatidate cytidylyltransferase
MVETLADPLVRTFLGVYALLVVASALGWWLVRRRGTSAVLANLNDRVRSWWVIVTALALAFLFGPGATILLFGLVSFWCLREFLSLTPARLGDHYALAAAYYLFLPLQYWLLFDPWLAVFTIAIPVYAYLLLPVLALALSDTRDFLQRISRIQWALMLAVYCLAHAPALLILDIPGHAAGGFGLIAFLLLVVQFSDVAQYTVGKLAGRRKLAPAISPNKTWEGLLGGGLAATLLGGALHGLTPFGSPGALAMAFMLVVAGALGGLVLSAVKRSLGAKDWGTMVEGHGGMLDRADSLAFAAPLFFHITNYLFAV